MVTIDDFIKDQSKIYSVPQGSAEQQNNRLQQVINICLEELSNYGLSIYSYIDSNNLEQIVLLDSNNLITETDPEFDKIVSTTDEIARYYIGHIWLTQQQVVKTPVGTSVKNNFNQAVVNIDYNRIVTCYNTFIKKLNSFLNTTYKPMINIFNY